MGVREAQPIDTAVPRPAPRAASHAQRFEAGRRRRFSALFGRATEVGAIREGEHSRTVLDRDTRFRRALAIADVLAALAVTAAVLPLAGAAPKPAALLLLPLLGAMGKVAWLYDRDENLLSKTTLDELPALFHVLTVLTVLLWLFEPAFFLAGIGRPAIAAFWILLFVTASLARACARRFVLSRTVVERCLVLGDRATARQLAAKLRESPVAGAEIVGYIPLVGGRFETASDAGR